MKNPFKKTSQASSSQNDCSLSEKLNPGGSPPFSDAEIKKLFDELQDCKGKLETRNEQLILVQEKLRLSEEKYRLIFDNVLDIYYEALIDGTILEISPSVEIVSEGQYSRAELIGTSILSLYANTEDRNAFYSELQKNGRVNDYELALRNKDGSVVSVAISSILLYDANNNPIKIIGAMRDITNRKVAEEKLKKSEEKYHSIIELQAEGIGVVNQNEVFEFVNPAAAGIFETEQTELLGASLFDFLYPDEMEKIKNQTDGRKRGITNSYELQIITKKGNVRYIQVSATPKFTENQQFIATYGVFRDITEKVKAEENLKKLSQAVEQSPVIIYITDPNGCIEYVNPKAIEISGYTREELIGQNPAIFSSGEKLPGESENLWRTIVSGKEWKGEFHNKKKDGGLFWVAASISPIFDNDKKITHYLAVEEDITEKKQAQEELNELNRSLEMKVIERTTQLAETNRNLLLEVETRVRASETAEKALERSKQLSFRLALATRAGGVGVWDYDIVNNTLTWDDQMFALYNIRREDFSGAYDAWQAGLHPDDAVRADREIAMAIKGEKEFDTEFRVVWPDGTIRNIRAIAIVHHDPFGNPLNMIGTNWDITAQKRTETLLEQSRTNFETFFNTIDDFLFVLDSAGNMVHVNSTVINRLGYPVDELMDKNVLMVHPPERREEAGRTVGEMLMGTSDYCPVPLQTKLGELVSVETRIRKGSWDGKPAIFGVSKDVSKIKLSEEKFSTAFQMNAALMAISRFDNGVFLDVNETFIKTLGFTREELIGKTSGELNLFVSDDLRDSIAGGLKLNNPIKDVEIAVRSKSGEKLTGLFSVVLIYIGRDLCLLSMMVDITGRKRMEEELKRARHEAEQSSQAKSEFLSRMSHELRTPLNSILGFSQLLDLAELNPKHSTWIRHILSSGKHLLNLIDEVLDIARIESGKILISSEPVQLRSLILEARDSILPLAEERMLTLSWDNLAAEQLIVMTDRKRIIQVLINLLSNAVKYNKPGGSILIKSEPVFREDRLVSVRIAVKDSGSGIAADDLPKIFHPFERIGAEKTTTEGVGLGLAIVKSILEAMGGMVGVESTLGVGSTFWIELPV